MPIAQLCVQVGEATARTTCDGKRMRQYFEKTGSLLTADGSLDELVRPEGVEGKYLFEGPDFVEESLRLDKEIADGLAATKDKQEKKESKAKKKAAGGKEAKESKEDKETAADSSNEEPDSNADPDSDVFFSDNGDEEDNGVELDSLADVMPPGFAADASAPSLDKNLVGRMVAFLWQGAGWEQGVVCKFYKKLYQNTFNYEIEYTSGDRHDTLLRVETYGCSADAKPGSWVTFSKA